MVLGHQQHHRLGARAARLHGDLLAVEVLPALVEFAVDDREEAQRRDLREHADRHADLLDQRVGRADADIGLAADDRLGGEVLVVEDDQLDIDAALLGALDRGQRLDRFDAGQVAEGDAHVAGSAAVADAPLASAAAKPAANDSASGSVRSWSSSLIVLDQLLIG